LLSDPSIATLAVSAHHSTFALLSIHSPSLRSSWINLHMKPP
jgi:hypothetical protein